MKRRKGRARKYGLATLIVVIGAALWSVFTPEDLKISDVEWAHSDENTNVSFRITNTTKEIRRFRILVKSQISWIFKTYGDSAILSLKEIEVELSSGESRELVEELGYERGGRCKLFCVSRYFRCGLFVVFWDSLSELNGKAIESGWPVSNRKSPFPGDVLDR